MASTTDNASLDVSQQPDLTIEEKDKAVMQIDVPKELHSIQEKANDKEIKDFYNVVADRSTFIGTTATKVNGETNSPS